MRGLALTGIKLRAEGNSLAKAEYCLDSGSSQVLYEMYVGDGSHRRVYECVSAFGSGVELGLAVAAAILTHGHDTDAARVAIEAELEANIFLSESLPDIEKEIEK